MSNVVVLNTTGGADFTCMDCGEYVCAYVHFGEPLCVECRFLRDVPAEHRGEARRQLSLKHRDEARRRLGPEGVA